MGGRWKIKEIETSKKERKQGTEKERRAGGERDEGQQKMGWGSREQKKNIVGQNADDEDVDDG